MLHRFRSPGAAAAAALRSTCTSARSVPKFSRSADRAITSVISECPASSISTRADLDQKFRSLSRHFHPDYFYNATPAERRASLERSSYLNDAYRTLRQPIARIGYLLELEGLGTTTAGHASNEVPPALLEEVFALNEELDSVRELRNAGAPADEWRGRLEQRAEADRNKTGGARNAPAGALGEMGCAPRRGREMQIAARYSVTCGSACWSGTISITCWPASRGN